MRRMHVLLTGLSLVIVALSLNRLAAFTQQELPPHGFLRWLDFNAMLPIPIASIVLFYLLKKDIERAGEARPAPLLTGSNIAFVLGVFLLGTSSGDHETTNFLNHRFCTGTPQRPAELCDIVAFHDDVFSHVLYYVGVVLYTLALVVIEWRYPRRVAAQRRDLVPVLLNAALIAAGIVANLAFEDIGFDLVAFAVVAIVANTLLWTTGRRWNQLPFTLYTSTAFGVGLAATVLVKPVL